MVLNSYYNLKINDRDDEQLEKISETTTTNVAVSVLFKWFQGQTLKPRPIVDLPSYRGFSE